MTTDPSRLEKIVASITVLRGQRAKLATLIADRQAAAASIAGDIASAQDALDAAHGPLGDALAAEATGELGADAVADARAAVANAARALATAQKRQPEGDEHSATARSLATRLATLDAELGDLKSHHEAARLDALKAALQDKIAAYTESASATIEALAEVIGMDRFLTFDLGKPQGIVGLDVSNTFLPSFAGHPCKAGVFNDLVQAARRRAALTDSAA